MITMNEIELTPDLSREVRGARMRFLDAVEAHRPDLYRYCRSLTRSPWDAEDLSQETLLRAFARFAQVHHELRNPRAYLFRIASRAWIDRQRKRGEEPAADLEPPAPTEPAELAPEVRDALESLARDLPPRERVAVLLKDVFGFSLREVATALDTTVGAVKIALHRGRRRLGAEAEQPRSPSPRAVSSELLDRFVQAFNARDLPGLTNLFLEDAEAEVVGMVHELGRDAIANGSLAHTMQEEGSPRAEHVPWRGEQLVVIWYTEEGTEAVGDVLRFAEDEGSLRSLHYYYFCPELLREIAADLGLPARTHGYRYQPSQP